MNSEGSQAPTVQEAGERLYAALTHHFGPLDLSADQPLVRAVVEYGERCREGDDEAIGKASARIWEVLSHHKERLDLGARDPVVQALSEYGTACRAAGPRT